MKVVVITTQGEIMYDELDIEMIDRRFPSIEIVTKDQQHFRMFYNVQLQRAEHEINAYATRILPLTGYAYNVTYGDAVFVQVIYEDRYDTVEYVEPNIMDIEIIISNLINPCTKKEGCNIL